MKALRLVAAFALTATSLTGPVAPLAAASEQSNNQGANAELLQFCYDLIASNEFPSLTLGECMSFNVTSEDGFKAHFCDYVRGQDLYDEFGFTSYSDCVRNVAF